MNADWEFEHSVLTTARRSEAWAYWTDMGNHADMEPGIDSIELDGPFQTGTRGRSIGPNLRQEWTLTDVVHERQFSITGVDAGLELSFAWKFEDEGVGTRLTQRISARGPRVAEHIAEFRQMETHAPAGLARLAARLDRLVPE